MFKAQLFHLEGNQNGKTFETLSSHEVLNYFETIDWKSFAQEVDNYSDKGDSDSLQFCYYYDVSYLDPISQETYTLSISNQFFLNGKDAKHLQFELAFSQSKEFRYFFNLFKSRSIETTYLEECTIEDASKYLQHFTSKNWSYLESKITAPDSYIDSY
jgi:hypothetical protein